MKRISLVAAASAVLLSGQALAKNDFPTIEIVGYVLECMGENGGQTLENMYSCSCRFDKLSSLMSFEEYETAVTQRRFMNMPGERGGVFRESDEGRKLIKDLEQKMQQVNKACPVVRRSGAKKAEQP